MFDVDQLRRTIDLQEKSYKLLLWVNENLKKGTLDFGVAHEAMSGSQAAAEWIRRHWANLPVLVRPDDDQLPEFAPLFSSYLTTSFELRDEPGTRLESPCGCYCSFCSYLVSADHLKVRKLTKKAQKESVALKRLYLKTLCDELGLSLSASVTESAMDDPELSNLISLASYAHELIRRTKFASQGEGVLVLWREIAWERGPQKGKPGHSFQRPKKGFHLSAEKIVDAEKQIIARIRSD
jgi:hypothetical protein